MQSDERKKERGEEEEEEEDHHQKEEEKKKKGITRERERERFSSCGKTANVFASGVHLGKRNQSRII